MRRGPVIIALVLAVLVAVVVGVLVAGGVNPSQMSGTAKRLLVLAVLGVAFAAIIVLTLQHRRAKKNSKSVTATEFAEAHGLTHQAKGSRDDLERFGPLAGIPDRWASLLSGRTALRPCRGRT